MKIHNSNNKIYLTHSQCKINDPGLNSVGTEMPHFKKKGIPTDHGSRTTRVTKNFGNSLTSDLRPLTAARGIALVAVLAILIVLAIMAATFVTLMNIENKQSAAASNSQQLNMLINSGLEHAKAALTVNEIKNEGSGSFSYSGLGFAKKISGISLPNCSKWISVKNETGRIIGRYRIKIEDEAGKVNVLKAFLTKKSKGTGWDTGEIKKTY